MILPHFLRVLVCVCVILIFATWQNFREFGMDIVLLELTLMLCFLNLQN